ncbi:MAG: hypothetical protein H6713_07870 [Myxococcales bacterium]|nr:hypothetical protein [Myxococcales bacterium]MCB9749910.1 hypothetical protein [Myxococcales bacterium]
MSLGANLPVVLLVGLTLGGLAFALSLLSRRLQTSARAGEVVRLTSQHRLHVVEIAGRRLVVGTGPDGAPRLVYALGEEPARDG